jgi:adenylate cyclase
MSDVPEADIAHAAHLANLDIPSLVEHVESGLLGGPRRYTRVEIAQKAGLDAEQARRLWRALGFASVDNDEAVMFTDGDLQALRKTAVLAEFGIADEQLLLSMTRILGQTFSRLAEWQGRLLIELLAEHPELLRYEDDVLRFINELVPVLESVQAFVWRRQLAAYFSRVASTDANPIGEMTAAVGFADMSGFTTLTRKATEAELRDLLDAFESMATDIVGEHNGRIVKALGDEVFFVAPTAHEAAQIALELQEAAAEDDRIPALRIGLAAGPVVSRLGDVYGSTVNIASRLTSLCRPGWILVDRVMSEALENDTDFSLKSRRPESVRGFHHLYQWRLKRQEARAAKRER